MLTSRRRLLSSLFGIAVLLAPGVPAGARILIDDAPLTPDETMVTVPLIGYRAFPKDALVALDPQQQHWVLDTSVLYDAAATDSDFLRRAGSDAKRVRTLPVGKVIAIYQQQPPEIPPGCDFQLIWGGDKWEQHKSANFSSCPSTAHQPLTLTTAPRLQGKFFDKNVVQLALAKGAFERVDATDPYSVRVEAIPGSDAFGLVVNPSFAKDVTTLYAALDKVSNTNVSALDAFDFGKISQVAWKEVKVPEVTAIRLTDVKIGKAKIFPAKEKDLQVEPSILKTHDVYWLQLAINPRIDLRQMLQDLSFFVSLRTPDADTLELVPTKWGIEEEKTSSLQSPDVEVHGVKVGTIYRQEVAYKALKPTIVGSGLQDSEFQWSLSDESLDGSAKRLIAVVEVPKKTRKLSFAMIIVGHTKASWLGIQSNTATSEEVPVDLPLQSQ